MEAVEWLYDDNVHKLIVRAQQYVDWLVHKRNCFAWRFFVDDLKGDIALYISENEALKKRGKGYNIGIGGYCNKAKQWAVNYMAYYSAQKRRANFESVDDSCLDEFESIEAKNSLLEIDLLHSIKDEFGDEILDMVQRVMAGESLSRAELMRLKATPYLSDFLRKT